MCDTMVVVTPERVLFAKNSDCDPNEAQLLEWHPRRSHSSNTSLRCTWIEIPQANKTHAVLISRPFWMWGAEMGANEHGVAIGNEAVFTRRPHLFTGLTGMDLLRPGLERARTAADALEVVTSLLERHGQGGGCGHEKRSFTYHNSFLMADPREAYVLETAGRAWEVERVESGARSISNGLTIPDFALEQSDFLKTRVSACRRRQPFTQVRASQAGGPDDLMAILRDHGGTEPTYRLLNGAMAAPCMHAGGIAAGSQTTASWVAELTATGSRHWVTGTAAPCTGIFKPVFLDQPLNLGAAPIDRYDPAALWWRHEHFHRRVMRQPRITFPAFVHERDALEQDWLGSPPEPAQAFAEADAALARWEARLPAVEDHRPRRVRSYWAVRDRRAAMI
jgi:secernin